MNITFNSRLINCPDHCSVLDLLRQEKLLQKGGMAVAVNGRIVRKPELEGRTLCPGDDVTVVFAAYGG